VRKLYEVGDDAEELGQIFRLIDWMMHLTDEFHSMADLHEWLDRHETTICEL
jgi:hypothetical protein